MNFFSQKIIVLTIIILICTLRGYSQIIYDFENDSLINWQQSDSGRWEISSTNPIDGNYSLHHAYDNPAAGHDQISFEYQKNIDFSDTVKWSFRLRHTYNPSSANNWAVFLAADQSAPDMYPGSQISGIAVGVNLTGSDDILKLWTIENGVTIIAVQGSFNWEQSVSDSAAMVLVERLPTGIWNISVAPDGNQMHLISAGSALVPLIPETRYFGICYKYSSSQDRKLWIDDIRIDANFNVDTIGPFLDTAYIISEHKIKLRFDEPLNPASIQSENFAINEGTSTADSLTLQNEKFIQLYFKDELPMGNPFQLNIKGITDLKGNEMHPTSVTLFYYLPEAYDVLISEIMANPDPPVGLPPYEYLELYNRSEYPVNIKNWSQVVRNYIITLPQYIIPSHEYLILCPATGKAAFDKLGSSIACWNDEYLLTNTGTSLMLMDSGQNIISFLNYSDDWYNDAYKKSGGWSLEMIDPMNPCGGKENWLPSNDKSGGTPGKKNSVWGKNPDNLRPEYRNIRVPGDSIIIVNFSEPLGFEILHDSLNFFLDNEIGYPDKINITGTNFSSATLNYKQKLEQGKTYKLYVRKKVCDCVGNPLSDDIVIPVALPQQPDSFDVVINEVLFNPFPFGSEFIEIYNRSNKVIDAGSLIIAILDTVTGKIKDFSKVADNGFLLFPGAYLAITKDKSGLEKFYQIKNPETILESDSVPTLPDKNGIIGLLNMNYGFIDKFNYNSKMHFSMLSNPDGVSLERLNADYPTQMLTNWHSAAQTAGYATPGYANSQMLNLATESNFININPEVFSPNNDGHDDVLTIRVNPESTNCTLTIHIFDASGRMVKYLVQNQSLGSENIFTWDGTSDDRKIQYPGIYIIYFLLVYDNGKTQEFKKVCVIGK